jgi:hypothetical protein
MHTAAARRAAARDRLSRGRYSPTPTTVPKKSIDDKIDDLALSVGRGLNEVRQEIREGFAAVGQRFDAVEVRLERIEFLSSAQERRISIVEDRVRQRATTAGLDFGRP